MEPDIQIRPYEKGDEEGIVTLLSSTLQWPGLNIPSSPLDHWTWKNLDSPNGSFVIVADHDCAIVGCSHISIVRCKVVQDEIYLGNGIDVAVHPDYRKLGIFNRMNKKRFRFLQEKNISLALWSSGNPILFKKWNQISASFPHELHGHVRIRDIDLQLKHMKVVDPFIVKTGYTLLSSVNKLRRKLAPKASESKIEVYPITLFEQDVDELWAKASTEFDFVVVRNSTYLNWRYCDRRAGEYTVFGARDGDELAGYIVLATNSTPDGYPMGYIVDLFTLPSRPDATDALLNKATETFDEQGINIITVLSNSSSPYKKNLYRAGFLDSLVRYNLWYSSFDETSDLSKKKLDVTHFQFGDRDTLPIQVER